MINYFHLILLLFLSILMYSIKVESFNNTWSYRHPKYYPYLNSNPNTNTIIPIFYTHTNYPWNNMQIGTRRRMSWDLRGDPYIVYPRYYPWNNPEVIPIQNKSIC